MTDPSTLTDRELDALVAEEVFGDVSGLPPRVVYPTDIAAAWRVVERMRELGFYLNLYNDWHANHDSFDTTDELPVHARFDLAGQATCDEGVCADNVASTVRGCATAPTAPRAICEAALKALL